MNYVRSQPKEVFVNDILRRDLWRFCPVLVPGALRAAPAFRIEEWRIAEHSDKPDYDIDLRYPHMRDTEAAGTAQTFNAAVNRVVIKRLAHYRARQLPPKDSPHGGRLLLRSAVTTRRDGVISVLFDWDCAIAGNFHSNQELGSLVLDTHSGERIELSALFRPEINYAMLLSGLAITDLVRQKGPRLDTHGYDRKWIENGAGPVDENFRVFTLTDRDLVLHFATYQVGSYVEHAYTVQIPWQTLEAHLASRWRLHHRN